MIHVAWPWMLLMLPLPWLAARWLPAVAPRGNALFLPFAAALAADAEPGVAGRPRWRQALFLLTWLLLLASAVRPQWLGEPEPAATTGRRLMLAVDTSGSMQTRDMAGNASRLQVVQQVAGDFIRRRHGDQVGLILFGTRPYLQAPLSTDLATVNQFLQEAVIGIAGPETALGDAIGLALKRLKADPHVEHEEGDLRPEHRKGDTVLVLLTDGSSNAGEMPPLQAARMAASAGLRIYTIGVGAAAQEGFFGFAGQGNDDLDEATLKSIAEATGGAYFRAADGDALQKIYARIDELEPSAGNAQWVRPSAEWFIWPLGAALLLSVAGVVVRGR